MIGITQDQITESVTWLIGTQFELERIKRDSEEFDTLTNEEGIYGYHTLGIALHDLAHVPMPQKYGTTSLLVMDECDEPRLVTLADHKGNVMLGFFRLKPKSASAYSALHFVVSLWNGSTLPDAIRYAMPLDAKVDEHE